MKNNGLLCEDGFVLAHEYIYLTMVRGQPACARRLQDIGRLKAMGMCNGFRIVSDWYGLTEEEFDELSEDGRYFLVVDLFRCRPRTIEMVLKKMVQPGRPVWACLFGERDNGCRWADRRGYFATRREAARWFKDWVLNRSLAGWHYRLKALKSTRIPGGNFSAYLQQPRRLPWLNLMAHAGSFFALHHYYEWGFRFVWLEHNCFLHNVNLGAAFLRGAARQHGGHWGVHYSPFRYHPTPPSEALLLREWLFGYLSGANLVHIEGSDLLLWKDHWRLVEDYGRIKKGKNTWAIGKMKLNRYGENARKIADFSLRKHPDRGRPYAPVALMLEHNHGWDPPRYEEPCFVWGNKAPYEPGDRMIECFFEWLFPDYRLASWRCFDRRANPAVPWTTDAQHDRQIRRGLDERPFERGVMTSTRWGDCFDVVLENCPLAALQNYPMVILLGGIKLSPRLLGKLKAYVEAGGRVVVNAAQFCTPGPKPDADPQRGFLRAHRKEIEAFLGARLRCMREAPDVFGPTRCHRCGATFQENRYMLAGFRPLRAQTMASNHRRQPIALRHRLKKGEVITITPLFGTGMEVLELLQVVAHVYDHLLGEVIPVRIHGPPVQYTINQQAAGFWITLFNHGPERWRGSVEIRTPLYTRAPVRPLAHDIWNEHPLPVLRRGSRLRLPVLDVAPFGFRVCQVTHPPTVTRP